MKSRRPTVIQKKGLEWDGMLHQQLSIPSNAIQMTGMCMQWTIMNWNGTQLWFGRWGWFCWDTMAQILPSSFDWWKQTMRVCVFVISGRLMLWKDKDKEKFNTVCAMVNVMPKLVIPFLNFVLCRMIILTFDFRFIIFDHRPDPDDSRSHSL